MARFAPTHQRIHSAYTARTQRTKLAGYSYLGVGIAPHIPVNDWGVEVVHVHEATGGVEQHAGSVLPPERSLLSLRQRVGVIVGSRREGDAEEMVVEGTAAHELEYEAAVRAVE